MIHETRSRNPTKIETTKRPNRAFLILLVGMIICPGFYAASGGEPIKRIKTIMKMTTETTTQDIWLAAVACQNGYKLQDLRKLGDRKLFVFEDSDGFQLLKRDYYWHQAKVDPLKFKKAIRELKALTVEG